MSSTGWQIFGIGASMASTVALVPLAWGWFRSTLPSARMRDLETLSADTEKLLNSALKEGTIDHATYLDNFDQKYLIAKGKLDEVRMKVYNIGNGWQELRQWLSGLSTSISSVSEEFVGIRARVATKSSAGRRKMAEKAAATCTLKDALHTKKHSLQPVDNARLCIPVAHPPHNFIRDATARDDEPAKHDMSPSSGPGRSASIVEKRRATRHVLLGFSKKLMSHGSAVYATKRRNDYQSRLRALSGRFHPIPTVLPLHIDPSALPRQLMQPEKVLEAAQQLEWEDSGHVIVEVHLTGPP